VPSDDLVDGVDEHRAAQRSKRASDRPCETDLSQERDASSGIAGNRRSVPEDEPPALVPRLFGHVCEQAAGLIIASGKRASSLSRSSLATTRAAHRQNFQVPE
jgi:hypothetical protein